MAILLKTWSEQANAGDVFSEVLIARLSGEQVEVAGEAPLERGNLVAVGSILHWADGCSTVWGAGFIDPTLGVHAPPREILAVRGPLSADRLRQLGLSSPSALGDPGAFAPEIFHAQAPAYSLGIAPHYVDVEHPWAKRMAAAGAEVIDPLSPLETYMARLSACERVAASSLHGMIFAHAYGIPAAWVRLSDRVLGDGFKFRDYLASVGLRVGDQPRLDGASSADAVAAACCLPPQQIDKAALREVFADALPRLTAGTG